MRILHVVPLLEAAAARAVEHLIAGQRHAGHVVSVLHMGEDEVPRPAEVPGSQSLAAVWAQPHDIAHAHSSRTVQSIRQQARTAPRRRPIVVTLHDWMPSAGDPPTREGLDAIELTGRIAVPAAMAAVRLISQGVASRRIRVIPYPVDPAPAPGRAEQPLLREMVEWRNRGGDILCAVANNAAGTHHRVVLEALSILAHRESTMCVLMGDVDVVGSHQRAHALGLSDQVRICPPGSDPRILASRADATILPAFDERRPFALAEVWCDGVPVLAGRNPQFTDLDAQGGGTLFYQPGDVLDLARAIATVRSTTPAGRRLLVDCARVLYKLRFTRQAVLDAYMGEYQALIAPNRSVA